MDETARPFHPYNSPSLPIPSHTQGTKMREFIRNNQYTIAIKRSPYRFAGGNASGWAILYLPSRDRYGHQSGDREEFATETARDAAFERIPQ